MVIEVGSIAKILAASKTEDGADDGVDNEAGLHSVGDQRGLVGCQ